MALINSSNPRGKGLVETVMPENPNSQGVKEKESRGKGKSNPRFEDHLEAPEKDAKSLLSDAQRQTQGSTRSNTEMRRPLPAAKSKSPIESDKGARPPEKSSSLIKDKPITPRADGGPKASSAQSLPPRDSKELNTSERHVEKSMKKTSSPLTEKSNSTSASNSIPSAAPVSEEDGQASGSNVPLKDATNEIKVGTTQTEVAASPLPELTAEGDSWQKRLTEMMMFMGIPPQSLQQDLPSLAILTGQLQNVDAGKIPATLAESPLINQLVASPDPGTVIEEVKPLGQWLHEMGWSPDGFVVQDPNAFQKLMNTPTSLKDVMTSFGIDVERVVTEAKILQSTLPMEGAAPYMTRATRMGAETSPKKDKATPTIEGQDPAKNEVLAADALQLAPTAMAMPFESMRPMDAAAAAKSLEPLSQNTTLESMMAIAQTKETPLSGDFTLVTTKDGPSPFASLDLQSSEAFHFESEAPVEPTPMPKNIRQNWIENIQAFQIQKEGVQENAKARALSPEFVTERMTEVGLASLIDEGSSDEGSGEDFTSGGDSSSPEFTQQQAQKSQNTFELGVMETQKAQPAQPVQKAVLENAQMLVNDGGGSVRIELGSKETGSIDLAVEVKDDKVEVKISASSPEARQMLAQELPRLRESLQNQNLNLSKVEVGLTGQSSFTSADGRSSQRESSSSSESEEWTRGISGPSSKKTSRSYSSISNSSILQPAVTRDGGGIQVRV